MGSEEPPAVSVVLCTRNRSDQIGRAVGSVLGSRGASYELIVVDQSEDAATQDVIAPWLGDPHLRYTRSSTSGLSRAANIGIGQARGEIVAFTDDDCEVPPDWLARIAERMTQRPELGAIFGAVDPAPGYDLSAGWLPFFHPRESCTVGSSWDVPLTNPMGANMAFRKKALDQMGGFDLVLGAGAPLRSANDVDALYRALVNGWSVHIAHDISLVHYGYRDYASGAGRKLLLDSQIGNGAYYGKHIRCGDPAALRAFMSEMARSGKGIADGLLRGTRPLGLRQPVAYAQGLLRARRYAIDRSRRLYVAPPIPEP